IKSVDNVTGWVNGDYLTIQGGNVDAKVQNVLNLAFKQQGKPYEYYLNPKNFTNTTKGMMQFLKINSYRDGISESSLNSYLNGLS
ncbi:hypothetical protein ACTPEF_24155, partial [Clostridioides difficile]